MELTIRSKNSETLKSGNTLREEDLEADFSKEIHLLKMKGLLEVPSRAVESLFRKLDILEIKQ